jgi:hypothetical protein
MTKVRASKGRFLALFLGVAVATLLCFIGFVRGEAVHACTTGDVDCDGFSDWNENYVGTMKWVACPANKATLLDPNDPNDAWPVDLNQDQKVSLGDQGIITQYWVLGSVCAARES